MRFCEGVVPCGTALFEFVREARAHGITPLGKQDSLNSGGAGAGPRSDQVGIIGGFREVNQTCPCSVNVVLFSTNTLDERHLPTVAICHMGGIAVRIIALLNPGFQFDNLVRGGIWNGAKIPPHFLPEKDLPAGHVSAPSFRAEARPWRSRIDLPSKGTT